MFRTCFVVCAVAASLASPIITEFSAEAHLGPHPCFADCGYCPQNACGNNTCETKGAETCLACAADCGGCSGSCGDGTCSPKDDETCYSCEKDCGVCPSSCGDGQCKPEEGETCLTPPIDPDGGIAIIEEASCGNLFDDDADGKIDCADADCQGLACGLGCRCTKGKRAEVFCRDGKDNDLDDKKDCDDADCKDSCEVLSKPAVKPTSGDAGSGEVKSKESSCNVGSAGLLSTMILAAIVFLLRRTK